MLCLAIDAGIGFEDHLRACDSAPKVHLRNLAFPFSSYPLIHQQVSEKHPAYTEPVFPATLSFTTTDSTTTTADAAAPNTPVI